MKKVEKNPVPFGNWNVYKTRTASAATPLFKRTGKRLEPVKTAKQVDELLAGKQFPAAAVAARLKPNRRQARKFLKKRGLAFTTLQAKLEVA